MKLRKETGFTPVSDTHIRLDVPVGGHRKALREDFFVEMVINRDLTRDQLKKLPNVTARDVSTSFAFYRDVYADELKERYHRQLSTRAKGNTNGRKSSPSVVLSKKRLKDLLDDGRSIAHISRVFDVSEHYVKVNITYHGLSRNTNKLPYRIKDEDLSVLGDLDYLAPGLVDAAKTFYEKPHIFFIKLYEAFIRLSDVYGLVKKLANSHRYYVEVGKVPRDHIAWSFNTHELLLSRALLDNGIEHQRDRAFYKNYRADFIIGKLMVEVDGEWHSSDEKTITRDQKKEEIARIAGYKVIRFQTKDIEERMEWVIKEIKAALKS